MGMWKECVNGSLTVSPNSGSISMPYDCELMGCTHRNFTEGLQEAQDTFEPMSMKKACSSSG